MGACPVKILDSLADLGAKITLSTRFGHRCHRLCILLHLRTRGNPRLKWNIVIREDDIMIIVDFKKGQREFTRGHGKPKTKLQRHCSMSSEDEDVTDRKILIKEFGLILDS